MPVPQTETTKLFFLDLTLIVTTEMKILDLLYNIRICNNKDQIHTYVNLYTPPTNM